MAAEVPTLFSCCSQLRHPSNAGETVQLVREWGFQSGGQLHVGMQWRAEEPVFVLFSAVLFVPYARQS